MIGIQIAAAKYWLFCLCLSIALFAEGLRTGSTAEAWVGGILVCVCIYDLIRLLVANSKPLKE